ncbi:MAG TPA: hypothetical protein ENN55_00100, partial [Firmicutes bacterium]|nr:hypothetical protein [Bacillota bacterium]
MRKRYFLVLSAVFFMVFIFFSCGKENKTTTPSPVQEPTVFLSATITPSITPSFTQEMTYETATETVTDTQTPTVSPSQELTKTYSPTVTETLEEVFTATATMTHTETSSPDSSYTSTKTATDTPVYTYTASPSITPTFTATPTRTYDVSVFRGSASIAPENFVAYTAGNTLEINYTAGDLGWAGPTPLYGTLKITMPSGWSSPSLVMTDPGYFHVVLPAGGQLVGKEVSGRSLYVKIADLPANIGVITVRYGDKTFGGPGAYAGDPGTYGIIIEMAEEGESTYPIDTYPSVYLIPPTPTVTATNTPIVGEGSVTVVPEFFTRETAGNTLMLVYTAGMNRWAPDPGGTIIISIPETWSPPSAEETFSGYFYASASDGATVLEMREQGTDMIIRVADLPANTGTITITYGFKGAGGPGAYIGAEGAYVLTTRVDHKGSDVYEIAESPVVYVIPPTATASPTSTSTMTHTHSPTISPTHSITQTHSITPTWSVSP